MSGSPPLIRSSTTARARGSNTPCATGLRSSAGRRSRSSTRTSAARPPAGPRAPVSSAWSPRSAWARSARWQPGRSLASRATAEIGSNSLRCAASSTRSSSTRRRSTHLARATTVCSWVSRAASTSTSSTFCGSARSRHAMRRHAAASSLLRPRSASSRWATGWKRTPTAASRRRSASPSTRSPNWAAYARPSSGSSSTSSTCPPGPTPVRSSGVAPATRPFTSSSPTPAYGGAYAYGRTGVSAGYDGTRARARRKPRAEWLALQPGAHEGYVEWDRAEAIRTMVSQNVPAGARGAPKPRAGLLPGLRRCRRCGRKLSVQYTGAKGQIPRYACVRGRLDYGEPSCIAFGGLRVDDVVEAALLSVVQPAAVEAARAAEAQTTARRDEAREALVRDREAARYAADRAFRQYDAADPENRLVAGELEARWNRALIRVAACETRIADHDAAAPRPALAPVSFDALAEDLQAVWSAPTTDARLKKRIVRTLIHEAVADLDDSTAEIVLTLHWVGGAHTEHRLPRRRG